MAKSVFFLDCVNHTPLRHPNVGGIHAKLFSYWTYGHICATNVFTMVRKFHDVFGTASYWEKIPKFLMDDIPVSGAWGRLQRA